MVLLENIGIVLSEAWDYAWTSHIAKSLPEDAIIFGGIQSVEPLHDGFEAEFQVYCFEWLKGYVSELEYTSNQDIIDQLTNLSVGQSIRIAKENPDDILRIEISDIEVLKSRRYTVNQDTQGFTQLKIA